MKKTKEINTTATKNLKNLKNTLFPFGVFVFFVICFFIYSWHSGYQADLQERARLTTLVKKLESIRFDAIKTNLIDIQASSKVSSSCNHPQFTGDWGCGTGMSMYASTYSSLDTIMRAIDNKFSSDPYFTKRTALQNSGTNSSYATVTTPKALCIIQIRDPKTTANPKKYISIECSTTAKKSWYKNSEIDYGNLEGKDAWRE